MFLKKNKSVGICEINMNKKIIISIILLIILAGGAYWYLEKPTSPDWVEKPPIRCIKEGLSDVEAISPEYNEQMTSECCQGLIKIAGGQYPKSYDENCIVMPGVPVICSDCGNGDCEEWENKCNCPKDCQ